MFTLIINKNEQIGLWWAEFNLRDERGTLLPDLRTTLHIPWLEPLRWLAHRQPSERDKQMTEKSTQPNQPTNQQ